MLYIMEESHMSRCSGAYRFEVEDENKEEAEKLAKEYRYVDPY